MNKPALFLDRDGVINTDVPYVHRLEDFEFLPAIFPLCRTALEYGFTLFVVTNQAGIGRGYYSEAQYEQLTRYMCEQFAQQKIELQKVYHCPYHPEHGIGPYRRESFDRKPNPGMFLRAAQDFPIDMKRSAMIGNNESDVAASKAAGVALSILFTDDLRGTSSSCADVRIGRLEDAIPLLRNVLITSTPND